jgi:hypothetical protein
MPEVGLGFGKTFTTEGNFPKGVINVRVSGVPGIGNLQQAF